MAPVSVLVGGADNRMGAGEVNTSAVEVEMVFRARHTNHHYNAVPMYQVQMQCNACHSERGSEGDGVDKCPRQLSFDSNLCFSSSSFFFFLASLTDESQGQSSIRKHTEQDRI